MLRHENFVAKMPENRLDPKRGEIWYRQEWEAWKICEQGSVESATGIIKLYVTMIRLNDSALRTITHTTFVKNWFPFFNAFEEHNAK